MAGATLRVLTASQRDTVTGYDGHAWQPVTLTANGQPQAEHEVQNGSVTAS